MAVKNPKLPKAHQQIEYTDFQLKELEKCAQDPIYCIKTYFRIQHPTRGAINFELFDFQEDLIRLYYSCLFETPFVPQNVVTDNTPEISKNAIVTIGRQSGKTQTSAAFLLWFAIFHDDKTILVASNHNGNAMEIISRMQYMYEEIPNWLKPGTDPSSWNMHEIGFDNKSRVISQATTKKTGRGLSLSGVFTDELAFVEPNIQQLFWTSIAPTLSTGGFCIITSTPNGDTELFAELWRGAINGLNGFKHFFVDWKSVPGRTLEWAEKERGKIGELKFRQEYDCEFVSSEALLFDSIFLSNLTKEVDKYTYTKNPLGFTIWDQIVDKKTYIVAVDPATGSGNDFTSIEVFSFPELEQIMEYRTNTTSTKTVYAYLKKLLEYIDSKGCLVYFSLENNTIGEGLISLYETDETFPINVDVISGDESKDRIGFRTDKKSKLKAAVALKTLIETRKIKIRSKNLLHEMKNYVRKGGSYEAQIGGTDDCISAMLILCRILYEIAEYEGEAYDMFYSKEMINDITDEINLFSYGVAQQEQKLIETEQLEAEDIFDFEPEPTKQLQHTPLHNDYDQYVNFAFPNDNQLTNPLDIDTGFPKRSGYI